CKWTKSRLERTQAAASQPRSNVQRSNVLTLQRFQPDADAVVVEGGEALVRGVRADEDPERAIGGGVYHEGVAGLGRREVEHLVRALVVAAPAVRSGVAEDEGRLAALALVALRDVQAIV